MSVWTLRTIRELAAALLVGVVVGFGLSRRRYRDEWSQRI